MSLPYNRSSIQFGFGGANCRFVRLLDVPFIQTRQPHGNTLPAEAHAAFQFCLSAHVESPGPGNFSPELSDDRCIDPGTDEYPGAVSLFPEGQQFFNVLHS